MRLALIGPVYPFRGGIAHYTTALHRVLQGAGHSILMVSFKRQYPDWLFPGKSDRDPSISHVKVPDAKYWIDSLNPLTWLRSWRNMEEYEPEVIMIQWWTPWWAPAWIVIGLLNRLSKDRPVLFLCHNVLPHESHWWDPLVAKSVLRWGSHFIVQSDEERRCLLSLLPAAEATVVALPALDLFPGRQLPKEQARAQLDLPMETPVVLFFGIVRQYKGLRDLLMALPEVRARLGSIILLVAGEFWEEEDSYRTMISELGVSEFVRIDNRYIPNEDVRMYFSAADLLVAPYRSVTGSAVVPIAQSFGVPVITSNVGGLEHAVDGQAGILVPPSNPSALATAIIRYFEEGLGPIVADRISYRDKLPSWGKIAQTLEELVHS